MTRRIAGILWLAALVSCSDGPTAPSPDLDSDGILNDVDDCPSVPETVNNVFDADGCPDVPQDLYQAVRADVEAYWLAVLAPTSFPYVGIGAFLGYTSPLSTPCGVIPVWNAVYCALNAGVYFDTAFLGEYLQLVGDMAPAFIISHEIGHHISWHLDWPPYISTKEAELQADCFGGAWTSNAEGRGVLDEGDLEEAVVAVISVGDPDDTWFDPTLHGTSSQRVTAFAIGYANGPAGCTSASFFDAFPVSEP